MSSFKLICYKLGSKPNRNKSMKKLFFLLLLCLSCSSFAQRISTASHVEVSRYVGKWYAHYSLPQFFTRNCLGQTAEYEILNAHTISVLNTCLKGKTDSNIKGQAVISNKVTNAELIVSFNSFFTRLFRVKGDYNIMKLDSNYEYVLVGSRNRKSLWLMSRTPVEIPESVIKEYLDLAKNDGFDISKLVKSQF
jgi:apolipoprotein D and lipocalin family protein